jgi:hypothetical protein
MLVILLSLVDKGWCGILTNRNVKSKADCHAWNLSTKYTSASSPHLTRTYLQQMLFRKPSHLPRTCMDPPSLELSVNNRTTASPVSSGP